MTTFTNFPDVLKGIFQDQPLAVLATSAGTAPYADLVAVAFSLDLRYLFFAASRTTRKWRNLSSNPRVSLLMDNRSNQRGDLDKTAAATIIGNAKDLIGVDREEGQNLYLARHGHLADFVAAPDCAFFQVSIERIYLVTHFQEVMQFDYT